MALGSKYRPCRDARYPDLCERPILRFGCGAYFLVGNHAGWLPIGIDNQYVAAVMFTHDFCNTLEAIVNSARVNGNRDFF